MQRIPSTQALRALESFSRLGTVWQAADDLHVTRSAVSHQLRLLERELGIALFHRVGTRIALSSRGQSYAKDVRIALRLIQDSASRHAGDGLSGKLTVSCTPGFASFWLSPRIERFRTICPDVTLSILTPAQWDDVSNTDADVFLSFSDGHLEGVEFELLKEVEFTPLLSPVLLNRLGGLQIYSDVLNSELLHLASHEDWRRWFQLAKLPVEACDNGIVLSDMNLVYTATMHAQGIAMGDEFICHQAIKSGQLLRPFDLCVKSTKSYYLAIPFAKTEYASVIAFRRWLKDELASMVL